MNKRFLIAAGGTGGHFYPGFSVGRLLNREGCSVLFVVRKGDPAIHVLEEAKLKFVEVDFCGFPRSFNPLRQLRFGWKLLNALRQTGKIISGFKPDVVLGTGGYMTFPLVLSAHFKGVKTAVHDSNTKIGLANKICSYFVDLFLLGLPVEENIRRARLVGTPIRKEFAEPVDRIRVLKHMGLNPSSTTVLLFGGSQGAKALNLALVGAVKKLTAENENLQFIHISGERWYQQLLNRYRNTPRVVVLAYANEIYDLIHACDLVVCRSGAGTLAELVYCRKPALLVPLPTAAANHQFYNARLLQNAGCAALLEETPQLEKELYERMDRMLNAADNCILSLMSENYSKLNLPDPMTASQRVARMLKEL